MKDLESYALNQTHYIEKVVSKFSHIKIKDANTPNSSVKLEKNDGREVAQLEYVMSVQKHSSHTWVLVCFRSLL